HCLSVGPEIRLLQYGAVPANNAHEPRVSSAVVDRFSISSEIGFLDQVAGAAVTLGGFGVPVLSIHGFSIDAEERHFSDLSMTVERLCATRVTGAAYDRFAIDAIKRIFE